MELFAIERRRWLQQFIDLSAGIPSHQTLARVFSLIEPTEFENCLSKWVLTVSELVAGDVISIDGKTQRGSSHIEGNKNANHIISAYSSKHDAALAVLKTPDKTNEIKGIPILLKSLMIKDMTITMDAMGTQRGIVNLIREKQGNYVLALKKNHKQLYRRISADECGYRAMVYRTVSSQDYGHGRIEERHFTFLP